MNTDSHYKQAGLYNLKIKLPFISAIRRQEEQVISDLIATYADPAQRVLEVGPGTGFYTRKLAQVFREVVAIEDSPEMSGILKGALAENDIRNVSVLTHDFRTVQIEEPFDVAIAIGVLDYIPEPSAFVQKMCSLARRAVILTAPQRGLWGSCFVLSSKFIRSAVYCSGRQDFSRWAPNWECARISDVGLKTSITKGMTLIAALEPR